jgi:SAM-dependent methyltransferase
VTQSRDPYGVCPRPCPVCGSLKHRVLRSHLFFEGPLGNGYEIVTCDECGAGFADGIPSQEALDFYYAERSKYAYAHQGGMESPSDFERFETTLSQLLPFIPSRDARVLDIGCATGGMLAVVRRAGFQNVYGADPSQLCAETAFKVHGINVKAATLADISAWNERFDLILMLGVLEHIRDVKTAVVTARSLLTDGGHLYCAVPNVERLTQCANAPFQQFSFEHVNFFSAVSLNNLLGVSGMSAVQNWTWETEWRKGVMEPIVSGLFQRSASATPNYDQQTRPALESYIAWSNDGDRHILGQIEALKNSQESILIWGAGTLARRLLATTPLTEVNIAAFVDSNPQLQGSRLAGRPIIRPELVRDQNEPIFICSSPFHSEILETIKRLQLPNRIISLEQ